jgi:hypothetical protein
MRFSIAALAAATGAMLLTGGLTLASAAELPPSPRPVSFTVVAEEPSAPARQSTP